MSGEDGPRSGSPETVATEETIDHVHYTDDRQLIMNQSAEAISRSCEKVRNILPNELSSCSED